MHGILCRQIATGFSKSKVLCLLRKSFRHECCLLLIGKPDGILANLGIKTCCFWLCIYGYDPGVAQNLPLAIAQLMQAHVLGSQSI